MLQIFGALWMITLFFGGAYWLFSAIIVLFVGMEALGQPFISLSLIGVPATLALLQYLMARQSSKKESPH